MSLLETEEFKKSLLPKFVNREREEGLLATCPHRVVTEQIACIAVSGDDRTPVDKKSAAEHCMTGAEIIDCALKNQAQQPYRLAPIEEMIGQMPDENGPTLLVLTNRESFDGSCEALNTTAMKAAASRLGTEKILVIPSSVHEVLLFPEDGGLSVKQLNNLITSVNKLDVVPKDRLSDRAMLYDHKTCRLEDAEKTLCKDQMEPVTSLQKKKHHI